MRPARPELTLVDRIADVRGRLDHAIERSGRPRGSVLLVAVTKTLAAEIVADAATAGLTVFGENRVQEAVAKIPEVARLVQRKVSPRWHLVGHLQSNKAKIATGIFELIHSVDDTDLAKRLDRALAAAGNRQAVLVQVNVAREESKSGVEVEGLRELVETVARFEHLQLRGLMTIPPYDPDPEKSRPHFAALRGLGEKVRSWLAPGAYPGDLSMGMSEDFEVAIEEGATIWGAAGQFNRWNRQRQPRRRH